MLERRYCELREADKGLLEGRAICYGEVATIGPGLRERFVAGAFGDLTQADVTLNFQHERSRPLARTGGGGLTLVDSPECLSVLADLPGTREGEDAMTLVRSGVLRGLSIEFSAIRETSVQRIREVQSARLRALGLVDSPAYAGSRVDVRGKVELAEALETAIGGRDRAAIIAAMADTSDIPAATIEKILRGESDLPSRESLAGFASALEVDLQVLLEAANLDGGDRAQRKRRRIWL